MWNKVYTYVERIADLHGIKLVPFNSYRHKQPPKHYDDSIILETTGIREPQSSSQEYKRAFYFPVLDAFIAELGRCFDEKNMDIMRTIQACDPNS